MKWAFTMSGRQRAMARRTDHLARTKLAGGKRPRALNGLNRSTVMEAGKPGSIDWFVPTRRTTWWPRSAKKVTQRRRCALLTSPRKASLSRSTTSASGDTPELTRRPLWRPRTAFDATALSNSGNCRSPRGTGDSGSGHRARRPRSGVRASRAIVPKIEPGHGPPASPAGQPALPIGYHSGRLR